MDPDVQTLFNAAKLLHFFAKMHGGNTQCDEAMQHALDACERLGGTETDQCPICGQHADRWQMTHECLANSRSVTFSPCGCELVN